MSGKLRVPIRLKILVSLLFVVTAVVSIITFTMANLFHDDKRVYINDIVSTTAQAAAEETRSTLTGYVDQIRIQARVAGDELLTSDERASLIEGMFEDFPDLIGIYVYRNGERIADAHNAALLDPSGHDAGDLEQIVEAVASSSPGGLHVRNASLSDLPALAIGLSAGGSDGNLAAVGVVHLESLQRIAERSRASEVFVIDAGGTLLVHPDGSRVIARDKQDLGSAADGLGESGRMAITVEVEREGVPMIGAYADSGVAGVTAAAEIPQSVAFLASRVLLRRLLLVALALLIVSAVVGLFWAHRLTRPLEKLSHATERIGQGDFEVSVEVGSRDEIGALAQSFNRMAGELDTRDKELDQAHSQLLQSEKMAAFGQLGAGIAHEVKNPLAGILGCAQLALRKVDEGTPTYENLELIQKETRRCKMIIENLLKFARQEKAEFSATNLHQIVEDSVAIVRHQLELKRVALRADTADDLPQIHGNGNQIQQVLVNLLMNAGQAIEGESGEVTLTAQPLGNEVEIRVADNGPGMPEHVRSKVFEPFFTTKPGGKGTGLGLSVSFGIIQDHQGTIEVDSEPGEGTTFRIRLPVATAKEVEAEPSKQLA